MIRATGTGALLLLSACGPRPAAADPQSCGPTAASLAPGATAGALEGRYRVRLVATSGPRSSGAADGMLVLTRTDTADPQPRHRHVLVGHGDLRVEDVGGPALDVGSTDGARPGVVGFDLPPLPDSTAPRVLLRLGALANRQDVARIEGPYAVLRVREIREDGFAGDWTGGAPLPTAEGYFCAWRSEEND